MKRPLSVKLPGIVVLMLMFFNIHIAWSDDVTDAINDALKSYKDGQYTEAAGNLDYAAQLIRQKKGGTLSSLLPEPLDGWTAEEATSQAAGAALFGGGVTAERNYKKNDASISVQYVTDSPMMQGVLMMFSNPMFATADGGKLERINGQKTIVKYDATNKSGDIQVVIANRFLVTVDGEGVQKEDLIAYVKAIDFQKLAALP